MVLSGSGNVLKNSASFYEFLGCLKVFSWVSTGYEGLLWF